MDLQMIGRMTFSSVKRQTIQVNIHLPAENARPPEYRVMARLVRNNSGE